MVRLVYSLLFLGSFTSSLRCSWSFVVTPPPPCVRVIVGGGGIGGAPATRASGVSSSSSWASGQFLRQRSSRSSNRRSQEDDDNEPDLFEFFDPLLSPHAYPNGIESGPVNVEEEKKKKAARGVSTDSKRFGFRTPTTSEENEQAYEPAAAVAPPLEPRKSPTSTTTDNDDDRALPVDTSILFDPTISPHAYKHGTPSAVVGDDISMDESKSKASSSSSTRRSTSVGILLVDHGSRNAASNQRLHTLAQFYQESLMVIADDRDSDSDTNVQQQQVMVRAAHMEIATPTIAEGIHALAAAGVDEIVCHPYFLSPAGRHVQSDLPRLVQSAMETLPEKNQDIAITLTDPVGSNLNVMVDAIHSIVQESTTVAIRRRRQSMSPPRL